MTSRVSEEEVRGIIPGTDDVDLTQFIAAATLIVDEELTPTGMSANRLKLIELYLSAHFTTLQVRQLDSEKFGDSTDKYQGKTGMNLQSSLYGQTACVLDTSGVLTQKGKNKASFSLAC